MQTRYTDAIPLASRPNLEQYKTLAKDLLKASRSGDAAAVTAWAGTWIERLVRLGVADRIAAYTDADASHRLDPEHISRTVGGIVRDVAQSRLLGSESARAQSSLSEAQLVIARLHGFESWPKFAKHVEGRDDAGSPISRFEAAADAVVTGDVATVQRLLKNDPELVHARSTRDHKATLLHYVAANGHEGFRQRTPKNAVDVARLLLEAGAQPDALADMYNYRCTTMEMLVSSTHPHDAGVQEALVDTLIDYGAAVDGVDGDGSPLMTAYRFHYPKAAAALLHRGAKVENILSAAAVGRLDLIDAFIDDNGRLRPDAPLVQVKWPRLPNDPNAHLGWALAWGCTFGPFEAVDLMLRKGVDPEGRDDDGTALHSAAGHGRMDVVRLLLKYGPSLETRNEYGGTVLGATLWYAFNAPVEGVDYTTVVRELIELGARVDAYPELGERVQKLLVRGG